MVPMWMFPVAIACGNTFVLKPSERDPTLSLRMAELLQGSGTARRRVQRRARRQGSGRRAARASGHRRRCRSSARRRSRNTSTKPARGTASACRRWAAPRTTRWCCPTRTSTFATEAIIGAGYGSAGERCMAISAVVAVGDVGDALVEQLAARARTRDASARATRRTSRWGRSITCAARDRIAGLHRPGRRRRRAAGRRRPRGRRSPGIDGRLLRRPDAVRPRHADDGDLPRGDLRAGAVRAARRFARPTRSR